MKQAASSEGGERAVGIGGQGGDPPLPSIWAGVKANHSILKRLWITTYLPLPDFQTLLRLYKMRLISHSQVFKRPFKKRPLGLKQQTFIPLQLFTTLVMCFKIALVPVPNGCFFDQVQSVWVMYGLTKISKDKCMSVLSQASLPESWYDRNSDLLLIFQPSLLCRAVLEHQQEVEISVVHTIFPADWCMKVCSCTNEYLFG